MRNEKTNFNTTNKSNRISTPNYATIVETTMYLLNAENPKEILSSLTLLFEIFLESETADDKDLRSETLHHYCLLRDFLKTSINSTPKNV
jgi:hypothetical protein